ncbi:MAG: RluA family pseudouridine synthase [Planctomycetes bacterium]|nr:RluA family pseudouridine synthase [Planctomycetota bacterium]
MLHEVRALQGATPRLVDYLRARLAAVPTRYVGELVTRGAVRVNGSPGRTYQPLHDGDQVALDPAALAALARVGRWVAPEPGRLDVVHEDEHLLVVCKPPGVHVHPLGALRTGTLQNALVYYAGGRAETPWAAWRPRPAQRLDRAASGLLVVAKQEAVAAALAELLAANRLSRRYLATVRGVVAEPAGTVDAPLGRDPTFDYRRAALPLALGGQEAITHWRVHERLAERTLLEVTTETGRTHQIRAHLALIGHPIVGDTLYSHPPPAAGADRGSTSAVQIALHAAHVAFRHPRTGASLACSAPPPAGFGQVPSVPA